MANIPSDGMNLKGSEDPRLCGKTDRRLNTKLGLSLPRPLVRETSTGCVYTGPSNAVRRRLAGMPERFIKD